MPTLSITLDETSVKRRLETVVNGLNDFTQPFEKASEDLLQFYGKEVFDTQGAALLGTKWRELSPATLKLRAARRGYYSNPPIETGKILTWTGDLRSSFKTKISKLRMELFNDNPKFFWNNPKRPMLKLTKRTLEIVFKSFDDYVRDLIKK